MDGWSDERRRIKEKIQYTHLLLLLYAVESLDQMLVPDQHSPWLTPRACVSDRGSWEVNRWVSGGMAAGWRRAGLGMRLGVNVGAPSGGGGMGYFLFS